MDFSLKHDRLLSFVASAMITASFLATAPASFVTAAAGPQPAALANALSVLRAANFQGLTGAILPEPVAAPKPAPNASAADEKPLLSNAQIQTLANLTAQHGLDGRLEPAVAEVLGLAKPGQTVDFRELNVPVDGGIIHAYHVVGGDFLIYLILPREGHLFRANAKQELVAAVVKKGNAAPVMMPVADAQKELKAELAYWAGIADQFGGGQVAASH